MMSTNGIFSKISSPNWLAGNGDTPELWLLTLLQQCTKLTHFNDLFVSSFGFSCSQLSHLLISFLFLSDLYTFMSGLALFYCSGSPVLL